MLTANNSFGGKSFSPIRGCPNEVPATRYLVQPEAPGSRFRRPQHSLCHHALWAWLRPCLHRRGYLGPVCDRLRRLYHETRLDFWPSQGHGRRFCPRHHHVSSRNLRAAALAQGHLTCHSSD